MTRVHGQIDGPAPVARPVPNNQGGKGTASVSGLASGARGAATRFELDPRAGSKNGYQVPSKFYPVAKRGLDLLVAPAAILLTTPIVLVALAASALSTRSWPLMAQTRIGQYGRAFKIYKIRTMNPNVHLPPGSPHKLKDDPRVGRVGRFLRKTSIDELPQFWNVLIGNMTLVGPRPELPEIVAHYAPWQHERHVVPPGITGWWQILWRSEKPLHHSTEDDIYYVKNRCLLLDLQILLRTPGVVFRGHGAY